MPDLNKQKMEAIAALLGMTNAAVSSVNRDTSFGRDDGAKLAMDGISSDDFVRAMHTVDKIRSSGTDQMVRGDTTKKVAPDGKVQAGFSGSVPTGINIPSGGGMGGSDVLPVLQSIDSTLQSILQILLTIASGPVDNSQLKS